MDAAEKRAEIEARRAARKAALEQARSAQEVLDLEAFDALEVEHGDGNVAQLELDRFVEGFPTFVVVRAPSSMQYKRFTDQVRKSVEKNNMTARGQAQELLGQSCWVYPAAGEEQKKMLDQFPGLLVSLAVKAAKLVEASAADEGKG